MQKRTNQKRTILLFGLALLMSWNDLCAAEAAAPPPKSPFMQFLEQDYLLGDWGGQRTKLKDKGVDFEFVWFGALPSNVDGGIRSGTEYEGALMMILSLDSEKLVGYHGGTFAVSSLNIHNTKNFSENYVGDLNKVSLLDFPDTFRLWELYYEQKMLSDRLSLKLGQLAIDRDFILPEFYNSLAGITFLNQTFFFPTLAFNVWDVNGLAKGHHALASTPYGAPGARLRFDVTDNWVAQVGVYDGLPEVGHSSGTRININEDEGALIYYELGYRINQGKDAKGLKGNFKLGGYYHTDEFQAIDEAFFSAIGLPVAVSEHSGNYGFYGLVDHQLYLEKEADDPASQGLTGFIRAAAAPPDRNLTEYEFAGGLVYKGLFPGRDWDTLGLAGSYLRMSDDLSDAYEAIGLPKPDYEAAIELSYKAQLTAWWTLQPSIQYTMHPGGKTDPTQEIDNALSIILMTTLRF